MAVSMEKRKHWVIRRSHARIRIVLFHFFMPLYQWSGEHGKIFRTACLDFNRDFPNTNVAWQTEWGDVNWVWGQSGETVAGWILPKERLINRLTLTGGNTEERWVAWSLAPVNICPIAWLRILEGYIICRWYQLSNNVNEYGRCKNWDSKLFWHPGF